jgi:hypothetical protein
MWHIIVKWNETKWNTIAASPQGSREPDRGHVTYCLHSKHTKTPRRYPNRPTAMSTIANTPTSKHACKQTHKKECSTAQRQTVILRMHDMNCYVIYYSKMKWNQMQHNSSKPSNITRVGMVLTVCIPNTQRHQGVIRTVQRRCQQSQIPHGSKQACKQANTQARKHHSTTVNGHIEDAWYELFCNIL